MTALAAPGWKFGIALAEALEIPNHERVRRIVLTCDARDPVTVDVTYIAVDQGRVVELLRTYDLVKRGADVDEGRGLEPLGD